MEELGLSTRRLRPASLSSGSDGSACADSDMLAVDLDLQEPGEGGGQFRGRRRSSRTLCDEQEISHWVHGQRGMTELPQSPHRCPQIKFASRVDMLSPLAYGGHSPCQAGLQKGGVLRKSQSFPDQRRSFKLNDLAGPSIGSSDSSCATGACSISPVRSPMREFTLAGMPQASPERTHSLPRTAFYAPLTPREKGAFTRSPVRGRTLPESVDALRRSPVRGHALPESVDALKRSPVRRATAAERVAMNRSPVGRYAGMLDGKCATKRSSAMPECVEAARHEGRRHSAKVTRSPPPAQYLARASSLTVCPSPIKRRVSQC
uniref:Uncharacterized protein n=1 Tax=Noctiluca scintillans TaxID=2966 RepID=A0A7S1FA41_NOCSC|mmetsp:Transcript_43892/g.115941  ORF Transcript_43892/g.115941 Transcript_43892/m.115941 type:complete len:319 (+) Transcript_43892:137-1093(+)